mgnify:CR=1 FL=1
MDYKILHIPEYNDELIAQLCAIGFEAFEEQESQLLAYMPVADFQKLESAELDHLIAGLDVKWSDLEDKNWNEIWEANFHPAEVSKFCRIRAGFHQPSSDFKHEIIINPKMAFGTGHHQTTWMMMAQMENINFENTKVLDYGCGTGILAILASKLGAKHTDALDIEEESYANTIENAGINHIANINPICGPLEQIKDDDYDIILANINRNVLLDTGSSIYEKLKPRGILLLSGILTKDEELILKKYVNDLALTLLDKIQKDDWICLKLIK